MLQSLPRLTARERNDILSCLKRELQILDRAIAFNEKNRPAGFPYLTRMQLAQRRRRHRIANLLERFKCL